MISLEQIKELESRVHTAVARIKSLTTENATLKERLSSYELRVGELEELVNAFKSEQQEIEAGIVAALKQLDGLEDAVAEGTPEGDSPDAPAEPEPSDQPPVVELETEQPQATVGTDAAEAHEDLESPESPPAEPEPAASPSTSPVLEDNVEEEPELDIF